MFLPSDVLGRPGSGSVRETTFGTDLGAGKATEEHYEAFVHKSQRDAGTGFRTAPYQHCAKLVSDCSLRMKNANKVLAGKEERTVVRLFGLTSGDPFHQCEMTRLLPQPVPAPDVNTLWLTLNRPEYYYFHVSVDLHNLFGCECHQSVLT